MKSVFRILLYIALLVAAAACFDRFSVAYKKLPPVRPAELAADATPTNDPADPAATNDPELIAGFAAFGHVLDGMDVVRRIWDMPRSATRGTGVLRGEMLESPVRIISVRRVAMPAPPAAP